MNDKQTFIKQGFSVLETENKKNELLTFMKEKFPQVFKDGKLNLAELKTLLGIPTDEKVNGYGLNFVGRGIARAKYAQETEKELLLNRSLSKNADTTQNMVLKGDNLDSLKLLKPHYSGKIKCIYIDPPYNTQSDEFVYPDKFDRHEAEVLGVADSLSDEDFDRMEFSFKTKKSHNGWLTFMYPRLLLARDLLAKDGVIFISIDDNEQANLKILCDEIFGEENFVANINVKSRASISNDKIISNNHNYLLFYAKNERLIFNNRSQFGLKPKLEDFKEEDENGKFKYVPVSAPGGERKGNPFYTFKGIENFYRFSKDTMEKMFDEGLIAIKGNTVLQKYYLHKAQNSRRTDNTWWEDGLYTSSATTKLNKIFGVEVFNSPKPVELIKRILENTNDKNAIILDFFAGSGTTGHAVMALNAEDGGNRKFILCQIDEPIAKGKPAYQFCKDNGLEPVISSITIERLRRAGSTLSKFQTLTKFKEGEELGEDFGFKVFDHTDAPKLTQDENGQIVLPTLHNDALSRIYTMIFKVGLDEPSQAPQEVLKDCIYKIGHHYYITNSEQISKEDFSSAIKDATQHSGKIFVDGWTASLNATLQHYKDEVQIVF